MTNAAALLSILLVVFVQSVASEAFIEDTNLAYGKTCGSSSLWQHFIPDSAVDGYLSTFQHTGREKRPYWWVDLGQNYVISSIDIYNRQDNHGGRLRNLEVTVGATLHYPMKLCGRYRGPARNGEHVKVKCPGKMRGRYVKLTLTSGSYTYLHVAEVQVWGHVLDKYNDVF